MMHLSLVLKICLAGLLVSCQSLALGFLMASYALNLMTCALYPSSGKGHPSPATINLTALHSPLASMSCFRMGTEIQQRLYNFEEADFILLHLALKRLSVSLLSS